MKTQTLIKTLIKTQTVIKTVRKRNVDFLLTSTVCVKVHVHVHVVVAVHSQDLHVRMLYWLMNCMQKNETGYKNCMNRSYMSVA